MKVPAKTLLVSIHDVTPAHAATIQRIVRSLARWGVSRGALLVVPDFHARWPLGQDRVFRTYLTDLMADSWEPILHGFFHLESQETAPQGLWDSFARKHMTAGEGEFLLLDGREASCRLRSGLDVIRAALGVTPRGFVPPAWLCGDDAREAIIREGFAHSEDHVFIEDFVRDRRVFAPALGWASRSFRKRLSSSGFATFATPFLARLPVVRLALHPGDFRYPSLVRSIERSLMGFLEAGFVATTYKDYLGRQD